MESKVALAHSGILARYEDRSILLDPSQPSECDFTFVSHAHVDHLHRQRKKSAIRTQILASKETTLIARARGYEIASAVQEQDGFTLVDTGHILGSRGLLIGDEDIFYTGDISIRERAFMKPARLPHARTLIIESTFGRPEYIFPALKQVTHATNKIISEMYDLGIPVILMGYTLGKAQLLTRMFGHWDPLYVHDSVARMNSVYSELGVELKNAMTYSEAEGLGLLSNKPWIMVAPLMQGRRAFVREMKDRYGAITIGFSGWAVGSSFKYMAGLDYVMPLSDHCDFKELVDAIKQCNPEKVYTFHGFAAEFARTLRKMGYDAEPVGNGRGARTLSLDSFQ
ncbi:MAG: MBL fold metallo-hydrolase [Nitrososphaera sp.]|nr:MBL fold metallo-hydrolase [Nitrososphaera sp.]